MRFIAVAFLLSIFFVPPQGDLFRKHYDAANAYHRAGNFKAAEAEFKAILGEAYGRLAKIYSAQGNYEAPVTAFETARTMRSDTNDDLVDLSIVYFQTSQFSKALEPLQRV